MKAITIVSIAFLGLADAYPNILAHLEQTAGSKSTRSNLKKRVPFDASQQLVDVTGAHAFVPPGSGDERGPCPGLNALANHGYLPHNGIGSIEQFIESTGQGRLTAYMFYRIGEY